MTSSSSTLSRSISSHNLLYLPPSTTTTARNLDHEQLGRRRSELVRPAGAQRSLSRVLSAELTRERCWKVGSGEGDVQRFDNSVDNAFDRGVQDVVDAPDDVAHFAGDQVRCANAHVQFKRIVDMSPAVARPVMSSMASRTSDTTSQMALGTSRTLAVGSTTRTTKAFSKASSKVAGEHACRHSMRDSRDVPCLLRICESERKKQFVCIIARS